MRSWGFSVQLQGILGTELDRLAGAGQFVSRCRLTQYPDDFIVIAQRKQVRGSAHAHFVAVAEGRVHQNFHYTLHEILHDTLRRVSAAAGIEMRLVVVMATAGGCRRSRSEERRVGKEWRTGRTRA